MEDLRHARECAEEPGRTRPCVSDTSPIMMAVPGGSASYP